MKASTSLKNLAMNLNKELTKISEYFAPMIIGEVNDVYIKLVKIKGDKVPWHNHRNEDELFYILKGSLVMEIENEPPFQMNQGDLFVVEKGVNHKVRSAEECHIMLIENKSTSHTGDIESEITKTLNDQLH